MHHLTPLPLWLGTSDDPSLEHLQVAFLLCLKPKRCPSRWLAKWLCVSGVCVVAGMCKVAEIHIVLVKDISVSQQQFGYTIGCLLVPIQFLGGCGFYIAPGSARACGCVVLVSSGVLLQDPQFGSGSSLPWLPQRCLPPPPKQNVWS